MYKRLQSEAFFRNPAEFVSELRAQAPLVSGRVPIIGKTWFTTTQAATAAILKNDRQFTVRKGDGNVAGLSWWMPSSLKRLTGNMLSSDEPEHTRLRRAVDHAFQRRAVTGMEDEIRGLAISQKQALFAQSKPADLIAGFSRPFPLAVICELLGLPEEDRPRFSKWASGISTVNGIVSFLIAIRRLRPLTDYIQNRIVHERAHGGRGLIHELVHNAQEELSEDELVAMIFLLLLAGHETTTHLIAGGAYALFENPDQLELLRAQPDLLNLAVEELLRYVSPVQVTKPRHVREDYEVEGVTLRKGDLVMPMLVAANFDPELFDEPEKLDITRKPNRHMEFGTGIHFCLGHQLARMEMKAALEVLFMGPEPVRLAGSLQDVRWNKRFGLRSLKDLVVRN